MYNTVTPLKHTPGSAQRRLGSDAKKTMKTIFDTEPDVSLRGIF